MNPYLEKCLPYLKKPFVNYPWLHCHPYSWSDENGHPVRLESKRARTHWYFNFILVMGYSVFVTCRTVQVWLDPAESRIQKFYMAFATQLYLTSALVHITVATTQNDYVPFYQRYISFLKNGETL